MKKLAARCLFVIIALSTLIWIGYTIENWRAEKNWKAYETAQQQKGVELYWKTPATNSVPDDQNFSTTPLLKAIGKKSASDKALLDKLSAVNAKTGFGGGDLWNQKFSQLIETNQLSGGRAKDAVIALKEFDPIKPQLEELYNALGRPHNFYPLTGENPLTLDIPNFIAYRVLAQLVQTHASANLALGQGDAALRDLHLLIALAKGLEGHPVLVSAMIATAIDGLALQVVWEGAALQAWKAGHLEQIRTNLAPINLIENFDQAMRLGERTAVNSSARNMKPAEIAELVNDKKAAVYLRLFPNGIRYQNMLVYNRLMDDYALQGYDAENRRVHPDQIDRNFSELTKALEFSGPYNYLPKAAIPNYSRALQVVARQQAALHMAIIACQLEQQKLSGTPYPAELNIPDAPHDPVNRQSLHYRPANQRYILYSEAWNTQDDGGALLPNATLNSLDWIWAYPQ